jgi:dihydrofolate reductase
MTTRPVSVFRGVCIDGIDNADTKETEMGKIVISTNVSLDGVVQDPDGAEGFRLGGWFRQFGGKDLEQWTKLLYAESLAADALLLGRRSDEWFGTRWASRDGDWADRLNSLPKYVVSSTLEDARWTNATVLNGDVVREVTKLKQQLDGEILVYASYQLARTLLEHDLVDEVRLFVFPVVLGDGDRLFGETTDKKPLRLVDSRTVGDGLVFVTYEVARAA